MAINRQKPDFKSGVSLKILIRLNEPIDFLCKVRSRNENPLFLRFKASAVTLSGSQAGNTCPSPLCPLTADPLPAHLDGYPTAPSQFSLRNNGFPSKLRKLRDFKYLDNLGRQLNGEEYKHG